MMKSKNVSAEGDGNRRRGSRDYGGRFRAFAQLLQNGLASLKLPAAKTLELFPPLVPPHDLHAT